MDVDGFAGFRLLQTGSPLIWESQVGLQMFGKWHAAFKLYATWRQGVLPFGLLRCHQFASAVIDIQVPVLVSVLSCQCFHPAQLRTLKCDYARRLCASFAFALTIWRCYWSDTPQVLDPATPWLIQLQLYNVKETVVHAASGLVAVKLTVLFYYFAYASYI